ncbi:ABC transporter substrate-binding protein [Cupriavidus gilardii]|uniref:ABC transporter substrate-binding protein n=1 Tax=Cupriavidus gilardii TaxID=82541 RepID=A0A849B8B5_9BURK|nr:ABC transporter substrate-binding protein [Cupriavidus gilardii]ALD92485.1 peptide/nickel transport system substrate-binding protein [Cupriavidus gilardii CR3]KAB0596451.1 ABC transporter substrate-binding protein [Cupriavidus gilardii]MCT9016602.1 ABC transporter substrate-binding protein [Cupriavidus gilardii]MCT9052975.1 ABC transporter substrate-binding protein [Cupriavidus gilardii]MCT9117273.1 ABC transporter substrate-binding protein [Cupriavidus gilardii]
MIDNDKAVRRPAKRGAAIAAAVALALAAGSALAQAEAPKYGGTVEIGSVYPTISALSWDLADWNWKQNYDTGQVYEQLFVADLSKARRNGGKYAFQADAWLPEDAIRGELAESWKWTDPLTLEVKLRKGVKFPAKPGVMEERELVAEDVVFSYSRQEASAKKIPTYFDHLSKVEARDKHTVLFRFKEFNAEWDYRFGWGYYSGIMPKEVATAGAANWKNVNGTGPFTLTQFVQGNASTYTKNPQYWDSERIGNKDYKLPFVDKVVLRTIKDEATRNTMLRTGKIDIMEGLRWTAVDELKRSAPQLQWSRWLSYTGQYLALRVDTKPFNDIRVRRALNMAVNKQEIVKQYYGGNAELFAYPQHPDYGGYYEPLSAMPDNVKELFTYNPDKARKLLAEAGYPKGFTFKVQVCACSPDHMELLPLIAAYLEQVGVRIQIQPMEYGAFLSAMTTKTNAPGYMMNNGHTNPTTTIRKSFVSGQVWNASQWNDPKFDKRVEEAFELRDVGKRQEALRALTREIVAQAPYIWLPTQYVYTAWWPWVKNYGGELRAGAVRPGPIYARLWIDQEMKKKMGF